MMGSRSGEKGKTPGWIYSLEFLVRDYECDLQGIVNNANYQHYLEHARHCFFTDNGIDFAALHERGIDLVVSRVEIDYIESLKSRDRFTVSLRIERKGKLRFLFIQEIRRLSDNALCNTAVITGVCLKGGRPARIEEVPEIGVLADFVD